MSYVVIDDTPGMTAELYDKLAETMDLVGKLPEGCVVHIAGPGSESWRIVAVWENLEKAQHFVKTTLRPAMAKLGIAPPTKMPVIWEVYSLLVESQPIAAGQT